MGSNGNRDEGSDNSHMVGASRQMEGPFKSQMWECELRVKE